MRKFLILLVFCIFSFESEIQGQSLPTVYGPANAGQDREQRAIIERQEQMDRARERMDIKIAGKDTNGMMLQKDPPLIYPKGSRERELEEKIKDENRSKKMVKPAESYADKYSNFLLDKATGIAKIFPDIKCAPIVAGKVISVLEMERCLNVPNIEGNGSLYSFIIRRNYIIPSDLNKKDINYRGWWDIKYVDQNFVVGNCCALGIISDMGKINIEAVTTSSPLVSNLINFAPKKTFREIRAQNELLQKVAPAKIGNTYALRSIAYDTESKKAKNKATELKVISDRLTVFKIVEVESYGSLIIIWKNLSMKTKN